ncbi:TPM domain-containing protein [Spirosoma utsteinense]|uniref:Membrane protein n=1 Tax=Spirosoma utsteinense TaxID=2585773 RepID=A0ABR6W512_9BACT|nr:TPM domain-containing protein [Spirosoma utsteinense]MBC3784346.1 putative membrane protein [Spirosoma utsteinense]MBC3790855.1 putative membrane protein [Spirosoma utsteinense]
MSPFTPDQQERIVEAIRQAEKATSGEIRVHVEPNCPSVDPVQRAIDVFARLGMHQTKAQNGVLFYLAHVDRKFAVLGDKGIDAKVPPGFWESTKDLLRTYFARGDYAEGLSQGIEQAGQQLRRYFPYDGVTDTNELTDDISIE